VAGDEANYSFALITTTSLGIPHCLLYVPYEAFGYLEPLTQAYKSMCRVQTFVQASIRKLQATQSYIENIESEQV